MGMMLPWIGEATSSEYKACGKMERYTSLYGGKFADL
jgi:hypothetical protein